MNSRAIVSTGPHINQNYFKLIGENIIMNELNILNTEVQTMSSLEIAELTGKQHKNTTRLIRSLIDKGLILTPQFWVSDYTTERGKTYPMYKLDSIAAILVVAQQSPEAMAKIINRHQELKSKSSNDPVEAARAWADQYKLEKTLS